MCHGHLDPKYQMRETEARMKHVSFQAQSFQAPAPVFARLRAMLAHAIAKLMQKGPSHV